MKAMKTMEETGRKSWLAGMGACNQSVEKSTNALDKLYVEGNALIQDLIVHGESVEAELKAKLNSKFKGTVMLEDKIAMLKAKFGLQSDRRDIQLEKLSTKVDNLIEVVAKLAQQKEAEKSTTKAASASSTKAKTATKTSSKSSASSKTSASKESTAAAKTTAKPRTRKTAAKKPSASKD